MANRSLEITEEEVPHYLGVFSWGKTILEENLRLFKPDYNQIDPRTCPLVESEHIEKFTRIPYTGRGAPLPTRIAYSQWVMDHYLSEHPGVTGSSARGRQSECSTLFRDYPLNFTKTGTLKKHHHMSHDEYVDWVGNWGSDVVRRSLLEAQRAGPKSEVSVSSEDAYAEVMNMISGKEVSPAALEKIKNELALTRKELESEKAKAQAAEAMAKQREADLKKWKEKFTEQKSRLRAAEHQKGLLSEQLNNKTEEATTSERNRAALAEEVATLNKQLLDTQKKTEEANRKVVNVWAKLKGTDHTPGESQGRWTAEVPQKRTRVGSRDTLADQKESKRVGSRGSLGDQRESKRARVEDAEDSEGTA